MQPHLNREQRDTVEKIFNHPASPNIEWRHVVSLLAAVGTATEHSNKLKVTLGAETEVLPVPRGKDIDVQMVVDLRRMLKNAGFAPDAEATAGSAD